MCKNMTPLGPRSGHPNVQAGFFLDLTKRGLKNGLSRLYPPTGNAPHVVVAPPFQKDFSFIVNDNNPNPRFDSVFGIGYFSGLHL